MEKRRARLARRYNFRLVYWDDLRCKSTIKESLCLLMVSCWPVAWPDAGIRTVGRGHKSFTGLFVGCVLCVK